MKTSRIWQFIAASVTIGLLASVLAIPGHASNSQANGVAIARANLRVAEKLPHWKAPGAPFQMSRLKGKRVWIITSTLTVPFVADIAKGTQQAAALAGWKTTLIDGKGIVSEWNRALG